MAEKTEKATPKKLRDARKKGQVAKSKEFPSAFTFVASFAVVIIGAGFFFNQMAGFMVEIFKMIGRNIDMEHKAGGYFKSAIQVIFLTSLPMMIIISIIGVLVSFLVVGPLFSMESMKPDIKKLNPVTNIKNLFKLKTIVELLKSIFKITGAVILIFTVVWDSLPQIISTALFPSLEVL